MAAAVDSNDSPVARRASTITALSLVALFLVAALAYGFELIVTPTTISDLVERRTGPTTTLVQFDGYALLFRLAAQPPAGGDSEWPAYRWLAVHDELTDDQFTLLRSPLDVEALQHRSVVGRLARDASGGWLLDEVERLDPEAEVRAVGSLAEAGDVVQGSMVRIDVAFSGTGAAICAADGSCIARRLADGIGAWDQDARDADGTSLIVRTNYPPSVAPIVGAGRQARDQTTVDSFLRFPWVADLLGWTHMLRVAHVEHDLGLPVRRDWTGPLLFLGVAALLVLGARLGYPRFRVTDSSIRRWAGAPAWDAGLAIPATADGHLARGPAGVAALEATAVVLRPAAEGGVELEWGARGDEARVVIPRVVAGLATVESGTRYDLRSARPAVRVGWFGSQLLLVFRSVADRDRVAAAIRLGE